MDTTHDDEVFDPSRIHGSHFVAEEPDTTRTGQQTEDSARRECLSKYVVAFTRADSISGRVVERAFSQPIHAYSIEHAREIGWDCATYHRLLSQDQRWTLDDVFTLDD